jgi:3-hydroxyacyl-CoA dehydrogenase
MTRVNKVAVIGAGVMGAGIAQVAAQIGKYEVNLCDITQKLVDDGKESIHRTLQHAVTSNQLTEKEMHDALNRIRNITILQNATSKVDLIIEATTEEIDHKKKLLKEVEKSSDERAILATNTSSIRITELASILSRPENFCGMHFFNPPQAMELVEVTRGEKTSDTTVQTIEKVAQRMGKETITLKKDSPGFIVNRILLPALNEAANLYYSGVADKEDIDKAVKLGLKWPMGPLKLIDQIGVDTVVSISKILEQEINSKFAPESNLEKMIREGKLGKKTGKGFYNYPTKKT